MMPRRYNKNNYIYIYHINGTKKYNPIMQAKLLTKKDIVNKNDFILREEYIEIIQIKKQLEYKKLFYLKMD